MCIKARQFELQRFNSNLILFKMKKPPFFALYWDNPLLLRLIDTDGLSILNSIKSFKSLEIKMFNLPTDVKIIYPQKCDSPFNVRSIFTSVKNDMEIFIWQITCGDFHSQNVRIFINKATIHSRWRRQKNIDCLCTVYKIVHAICLYCTWCHAECEKLKQVFLNVKHNGWRLRIERWKHWQKSKSVCFFFFFFFCVVKQLKRCRFIEALHNHWHDLSISVALFNMTIECLVKVTSRFFEWKRTNWWNFFVDYTVTREESFYEMNDWYLYLKLVFVHMPNFLHEKSILATRKTQFNNLKRWYKNNYST